jgi:hypothetical protein
MPRKLTASIARRMSRKRKTHSGGAEGRPRKDAPRCPCEAMTLARAMARGREAAHDPGCTFYRERAIIA